MNTIFKKIWLLSFTKKYEYGSDKDWKWQEEVVLADGCGGMEFLTDFCEGQTCVKNLTLIPLYTVLRQYSESKHLDN